MERKRWLNLYDEFWISVTMFAPRGALLNMVSQVLVQNLDLQPSDNSSVQRLQLLLRTGHF